jgi:hypothetical protein
VFGCVSQVEPQQAFKAFKVFVKLQFGALIECLHDNKGGEYIGHLWDAFFTQTGI